MTRKEFRTRIREKVHDWALMDSLRVACNATILEIEVTTGELYSIGKTMRIDNEAMIVVSVSGNSVTVRRGYKETTAAAHLINASITIESFFSNDYINQEITNAYNAIFPSIYRIIQDISLTIADVWKYDLSGLAIPINRVLGLSQVEISDETYTDLWRNKTDWIHIGDELEFLSKPGYTNRRIRLTYAVQYDAPTDDITETTLPDRYHELIEFYVLGRLQESRLHLKIQFEEYADKSDTGAASAGDILGVAGYSMYMFNQNLDRMTIPPLAIRRKRRRS